MNLRLLSVLLLGATLGIAVAQDATVSPQNGGSWQGRRSGRGAWGNGMGLGRGVMGTVTEATADHFTVRTEAGDTFVIHFSVNTRIMKQRMRRRGSGASGESADAQPSDSQMLKPSDIKVGDVIAANGEVDAAQKSVGAVLIVQIDPERAKELQAMEENFGKTWLMGRVTAIHEVTVTLQGGPGNATHTFTADENTTFRRRREPITLADVQVGDMVRVEGAIKNGGFLATSVAVMGQPQADASPAPHNPPDTSPQ